MMEWNIGGLRKLNYDLIVFGNVCCDMIMSGIEHLPDPGCEVWADDLKITAGGCFNVAAAASRLNLKTGFPCILGSDILSGLIAEASRKEAIDTGLFLSVEESCEQLSIVLNYSKDRSFISYRKNKFDREFKLYIRDILENTNYKISAFGISDDVDYAGLLKNARQKGSKVVLDCSWDEKILTSDILGDQIKNSDYFIPNMAEALFITGESTIEKAALKLTEYGSSIIIKLGPEGALHVDEGKIKRYPAYHLGNAVDTTGAGDNFAAGLCYGLIHDRPIEECIKLGLLCGSKSVTGIGGFSASLYENELVMLCKSLV